MSLHPYPGRFAPVAPVHVLEQLEKTNDLGHYHLVLTHDVVKNKKRFHDLFHYYTHKNDTIIVDNSVIELGQPVEDIAMVEDAVSVFAHSCHPTIAVLPDVLLDCKATVKATEKGLNAWAASNVRNMFGERISLMFVPQGQDWKEILECAEVFEGVPEIRWIGVARNFLSILPSRQDITQVLHAMFPQCRFHLLGFSDDLVDDILCTRLPYVAGIDSAVPLRIQTPISLVEEVYPPRGTWWDDVKEVTPLMLANLRKVRKWCEERPRVV